MPMMYEPNFNPQSRVHDIMSEGELANILSYYNDDFIISTVQDNIAQKRMQSGNVIQMPNFVGALEQDFKYLSSIYTADTAEINERRISIYISIINILCNNYNLTFNDPGYGNVDYFSLAFWMYDFLVCNFDTHMIDFFIALISNNAQSIYNSLDLSNMKKTKDTASMYAKQVYDNQIIAAISSNLKTVLISVSGYTIEFRDILNTVLVNPAGSFIADYIYPNNDFYREIYCQYILNENTLPINITNIRLELQRRFAVATYENMRQVPTTDEPVSLNTKEDKTDD